MEERNVYGVIDCHCDTVGFLDRNGFRFGENNPGAHVDLPRLRRGKVKLQFFAVCVSTPRHSGFFLRDALYYIHLYRRCLQEHSDDLLGVEDLAGLERAEREGKVGCLLSLEGAEPLEGKPELLDIFYHLGVRSLSLTWNQRNHFADGCREEEAAGGLTRLGRALVRSCNEKGVILDLAHLSSRSFADALSLTERPPLVSHANARRLCDHPRNLTDEQLKALAQKGGVIGLSYYPPFIAGGERATLEQLVDHFCHVAGLIGVEHLALGSDFDGIDKTVDGLSDASCHAVLLEALAGRGFQQREVDLIASGNVKRLIKANFPKRGTSYFLP